MGLLRCLRRCFDNFYGSHDSFKEQAVFWRNVSMKRCELETSLGENILKVYLKVGNPGLSDVHFFSSVFYSNL